MSLPHRAGSLAICRRIPLLLVAFLLIPGACAPRVPTQPVVRFEAFGAAKADGKKDAGEWDKADCTQFPVNLPGGGTVTADFCMMNDAQNLYALVTYPRSIGDPFLLFGLDFQTLAQPPVHVDEYFAQRQDLAAQGGPVIHTYDDAYLAPGGQSMPDITDPPGTRDGQGRVEVSGGVHVYELAHPLDTTDDKHDHSVQGGSVINFCARVLVGQSGAFQQTHFPTGCTPFGTSGTIIGQVKIVPPPIGGTLYTRPADLRVCGVLPDDCPASPEPDTPPHPCAEKPALCEKPQFQDSGMFLYCTIKPCAVHDELPRNCMRKFPCPEPPVDREPPYYHLTFTGLDNDWDVVLVDREGGKADHRIVPIDGGVVLSFRPDKNKHMPGLIGDYVAMFIMRESGRVGVRYNVGARLATSDRHYAPPPR